MIDPLSGSITDLSTRAVASAWFSIPCIIMYHQYKTYIGCENTVPFGVWMSPMDCDLGCNFSNGDLIHENR